MPIRRQPLSCAQAAQRLSEEQNMTQRTHQKPGTHELTRADLWAFQPLTRLEEAPLPVSQTPAAWPTDDAFSDDKTGRVLTRANALRHDPHRRMLPRDHPLQRTFIERESPEPMKMDVDPTPPRRPKSLLEGWDLQHGRVVRHPLMASGQGERPALQAAPMDGHRPPSTAGSSPMEPAVRPPEASPHRWGAPFATSSVTDVPPDGVAMDIDMDAADPFGRFPKEVTPTMLLFREMRQGTSRKRAFPSEDPRPTARRKMDVPPEDPSTSGL